MNTKWFLIVNPLAGNGKFDQKWSEIQKELNFQKIDYTFKTTSYSKHEIILVKEAIKQGFNHIISVGGDGTLHHIINGIMAQTIIKTNQIVVGVIPLGTGNDWIKTFNIPKEIKKVVQLIKNNVSVLQDIGCLQLHNKNEYFNNVAGLGYDGYVVNKLNKLKRFGAIAYLLSGITGLLFYKKTKFKIEFNNQIIETKCLMTIFGICKYSGGGMQMTDYKSYNDGFLDVTIAKNISFLDLLINLSKLYNGKIVHHKKVETFQTKNIKITPLTKDNEPYVQADGELIGQGEISVKLIEKAINFIVAVK